MSFLSGIYGGVFFLFRYNHPTKPNFFFTVLEKSLSLKFIKM